MQDTQWRSHPRSDGESRRHEGRGRIVIHQATGNCMVYQKSEIPVLRSRAGLGTSRISSHPTRWQTNGARAQNRNMTGCKTAYTYQLAMIWVCLPVRQHSNWRLDEVAGVCVGIRHTYQAALPLCTSAIMDVHVPHGTASWAFG